LERIAKAVAATTIVLAAWIAPAADGRPAARVPILEFHVIGDPPPGAPIPGLFDSTATFRAQVAWLARHGYRGVTLDAVVRYWRSAGWLALPGRPIVLSFDDGYPPDLNVALPALRARHWPAVLNLHIGNLVPARVRRLIAAGWEIDSHTFTHLDLTRVGAVRMHREIAESRRWIQAVFGAPANFFCYPFGRYDARVVAAVRRAGYVGAVTEEPGFASPEAPFRLRRIEVLRADGVSGLAEKLS
jgi:peptidoglycan/xylan/chitin deacetylase (PgdA/CDA1 family)